MGQHTIMAALVALALVVALSELTGRLAYLYEQAECDLSRKEVCIHWRGQR